MKNFLFLIMNSLTIYLFLNFYRVSTYADSVNSNALKQAQLAQEAYLQGNSQHLLHYVKNSLLESRNHPLILENIIPLYLKAQEQGLLDKIEVDWKLPPGIKYLTISVSRKFNTEYGQVRHYLSASALMEKPLMIEQLQILRFPDMVIVDKLAQVGDQGENQYKGQPSFWIAEKSHPQPSKEGLYLINIKVQNHEMIQGWFLITDENSSSAPTVIAPQVSQEIKTAQPLFRWKNFISPEKQGNEKSKIQIKINQNQPEYKEFIIAELPFQKNLKEYSLDVGNCKECDYGNGKYELEEGNYFFNVNYIDSHLFGELYLRRSTTTTVPFTISPKNPK